MRYTQLLFMVVSINFPILCQARAVLFVIVGACGVGKTTLVNHIVEHYAQRLQCENVIQYTTRKQRLHEINGKDYHFVTPAEFATLREQNIFIPAFTLEFLGNWYAPSQDICIALEHGISCILISEYKSITDIRAAFPDAITICIRCPERPAVSERLQARNSPQQEFIDRLALHDYVEEQESIYPRCHYTIMNDDLQKAVQKFVDIFEHETRY